MDLLTQDSDSADSVQHSVQYYCTHSYEGNGLLIWSYRTQPSWFLESLSSLSSPGSHWNLRVVRSSRNPPHCNITLTQNASLFCMTSDTDSSYLISIKRIALSHPSHWHFLPLESKLFFFSVSNTEHKNNTEPSHMLLKRLKENG